MREGKKVRAFRRIEAECLTDALKEMGGDADIPALFEPSIPSDTNTGELRHFLAAQTGRSPAGSAR